MNKHCLFVTHPTPSPHHEALCIELNLVKNKIPVSANTNKIPVSANRNKIPVSANTNKIPVSANTIYS